MLNLLIYLLFAFLPLSSAQWIDNAASIMNAESSGDYLSGGAESRGAQYVIPNEIYPEEAKPIWSQAPKGVYISVGTERGFIGASLSPEATHLLLIDLVPEIVFYNRMNVLLLKVSNSLNDYLQLRQATSFDAWIKAADFSELTSSEKELLRSRLFFEKFSALQVEPSARLLNNSMFVGSSYLKSEVQFHKLRDMARRNQIWVGLGNLLDSAFLQQIQQRLSESGLRISVLDLSNAWDYHYTGANGVNQIIAKLGSVMTDKSILLATNVRRMISSSMYEWTYHGFRYAALKRVQEILQSESSLHTLIRAKKLFPASRVVEAADLSRYFLIEARILDFFRNQPKTAHFIVRQIKRLNTCFGGICKPEIRSCKNIFSK